MLTLGFLRNTASHTLKKEKKTDTRHALAPRLLQILLVGDELGGNHGALDWFIPTAITSIRHRIG